MEQSKGGLKGLRGLGGIVAEDVEILLRRPPNNVSWGGGVGGWKIKYHHTFAKCKLCYFM